MTVPVARKSRAPTKRSGGPSTGPKHGHSGNIPYGGKTYRGGGQIGGAIRDTSALAPVWPTDAIPDRTDAAADQPLGYVVSTYLQKTPFPTVFSLITAPSGFTITPNGKITADGAIPGAHSITVRAHNAYGNDDDTFIWTLT